MPMVYTDITVGAMPPSSDPAHSLPYFSLGTSTLLFALGAIPSHLLDYEFKDKIPASAATLWLEQLLMDSSCQGNELHSLGGNSQSIPC